MVTPDAVRRIVVDAARLVDADEGSACGCYINGAHEGIYEALAGNSTPRALIEQLSSLIAEPA